MTQQQNHTKYMQEHKIILETTIKSLMFLHHKNESSVCEWLLDYIDGTTTKRHAKHLSWCMVLAVGWFYVCRIMHLY